MFTLKKYKSFCRSSRTDKNSILNYKKNGVYRLAKISLSDLLRTLPFNSKNLGIHSLDILDTIH